ncbi:MAG: hypothetical protein ABW196_00875 [Solirubrobacterales bacterium]
MPIDTKTLGTQTPETTDGRKYPSYLHAFERYDEELLAKIKQLERPTLNKLALEAPDAKTRSAISPWLSSAEWRGLIKRVEAQEMVGKRRYELTPRAEKKLSGHS